MGLGDLGKRGLRDERAVSTRDAEVRCGWDAPKSAAGMPVPDGRVRAAARRRMGAASPLIVAVLGGTALAAGIAAASHDSGMPAWFRLRDDLSRAQQRVRALEAEVTALDRERAALDDATPFALERAIREELGLARPGEVVVLWPEVADRAGFGADSLQHVGSGAAAIDARGDRVDEEGAGS